MKRGLGVEAPEAEGEVMVTNTWRNIDHRERSQPFEAGDFCIGRTWESKIMKYEVI